MKSISIRYLSGADVAALDLTDGEILDAIETSLCAQGAGDTVIEPRMHLVPDDSFGGHFNILRGYIAPAKTAGIKIVGDYHDNYRLGLPSEFGLLNLFDARTGQPRAVVDATGITEMRTGALTALGARYLAPASPRVLGHIGARGTAYWNVRLLDHLFDFEEIRVHSRRSESRDAFAARLEADLGKPIVVTDDWQSCLENADILVEASRLQQPEALFKTAWVRPGALVIPYGTMSTVEDDITDIMDKIVVDDWGQCLVGPFGCLRRHVDSGRITRESIHGELGEICAGKIPGRESEDETCLFWHRGLSTSDIALGIAMLEKAERLGIGHSLPYA
ncbi:MAG: ornithine cyclodeaminase family protein [Gammaproteobacteria bacterium]|nr:MAG: ornithine cyclodeaminase family protein [Gammaproteobacteria bacterium]UCH40225.1 MAG: ornithine cyclodeaminase family protein [Gammaproteobacteria bacterium]